MCGKQNTPKPSYSMISMIPITYYREVSNSPINIKKGEDKCFSLITQPTNINTQSKHINTKATKQQAAPLPDPSIISQMLP
jgi:hypothetical protein